MNLKESVDFSKAKTDLIYNSLSDQDKELYYKKEKNSSVILAGLGFIFFLFGIVLIILMAIGVFSNESDNVIDPVAYFLVSIISLLFGVMGIGTLLELKNKEKIIKRHINRKLKDNVIANINHKESLNNSNSDSSDLNNPLFEVTKEIVLSSTKSNRVFLYINEPEKKLMISKNSKIAWNHVIEKSKIYSFSDILKYEVYENGKSVAEGNAGTALAGGLFFGIYGAIIGASASQNINQICTSLSLKIVVNDIEAPQFIINYIDTPLDKNSKEYAYQISKIKEACSYLEFIINNAKTSSNNMPENDSNSLSYKQELVELKDLLDNGIITEEDFEQKKRKLLGL